ncbi:NAD(P)-dependent alcohol dehydrogenase [Sphingomicrobium arenosum]|uniref:NAD(P)-dependent alcohol dehydrogenase n=1 Tax=Sphingomicrobium arenosum TaxID=2233861 RepID=UPI002240F1F9|nr:NAD(P)-dependent alcohol dehydrogenase [Sphingomicrobium arenosum]
MKVHGYGALEAGAKMVPVQFEREALRAGEVAIKISHCGVCHSDLHQVNDDWDNSLYPCVPGHEIVGKVTAVGEGVEKYSEGDVVGVGCMVNSCQQCANCKAGEEQYCTGPKGCTLTYNGPAVPDGTNSYGGYSDGIIVREEFVVRVPDALKPEEAAPILCAGITTYQPMKHWNVKMGDRVGIAGIGGLGHLAIETAKALGAHVVALTTSPEKKEMILEDLGADEVIVMSDEKALEEAAMSLDFLLSTIPYKHDINSYIPLMKKNTTICIVGNLIGFDNVDTSGMVFNRIQLAGSLIGGVEDTQEILDFYAEHGIKPDITLIAPDQINEAFERMKNENVRFRHVIDMSLLKADDGDEKIEQPVRGEVVGRDA